MKRIQISATMIAVLFVLLAMTDTGYGQIVPYKAFGSDNTYMPATGDFGGPGIGSHTGVQVIAGNTTADPVGVNGDCLVLKWFVEENRVTAANGDSFSVTGGGFVELCPIDPTDPETQYFAVWDGEFHVIAGSGTGRFRNIGPADEPLIVMAVNDPFDFPVTSPEAVWTFSWEISGEIDLGNKGKK